MVYECGDLLGEGERFPDGSAPHRRRRRPRPDPAGAAAPGHLRRQPAAPRDRADGFRRGRVHPRPAGGRHRPAPQGRPVPVRARRRRAAGAGLLRGLQHPGLRARAAAARDRAAQGRHRRLRRARLDARADRRRQGDGPARPAAQRHPRLHAAGVRDRRDHQVLRHAALQGARGDLRGARHPPGREADAHRHGPPVRRRRGGLRRHLRERPGRAAHRLPVPDRQPARGNRARHRRPLRAGAGLVHLRRRRPDVALHRQLRRAEDPDPAPDPLGGRQRAARPTGRRGQRAAHRDRRPGDHPRADPDRARARRPQSTEGTIGPYALHDFTLFHVLRYGFRPSKIAFLAEHAWSDATDGGVAAELPRGQPAGVRPGRDPALARGVRQAVLRQPVQALGAAQRPQGQRRRHDVAARRLADAERRQRRRPGWPSSRTCRRTEPHCWLAPWSASSSSSTRTTARRPGSATGSSRRAAVSTYAARTPATRCPTTSPATTASWSSAARWARTTTTTHPWLPPTKALVRDAVERRTPTLGICLGHQLVAVALGGELGPQPARPAARAAGARLDRRGRGGRPAARRRVDTARRGLLERRHRQPRLPDGHGGARAAPRTASCRWPGSPRRCGASSCTPRSTSTSCATWAEEDRDRYAEGVLDEVLAAIARPAASRPRGGLAAAGDASPRRHSP